MKIKPRKIRKEDKIKYSDTLYTAMSGLNSRSEVKNFLKDLLTESERIMIGRRILIAKQLLENRTYDEIIDEMHVGKDTIMRVHKWLEDEFDGYEKAILGLEKEMNRRLKAKRTESAPEVYSFTWLKKKYPLHFLLFNLFGGDRN